jgi:hypothetical protein
MRGFLLAWCAYRIASAATDAHIPVFQREDIVVQQNCNSSARDVFLTEVWLDDSPFNYVDLAYVDSGYKHTNIKQEVIDLVLRHTNATFWIEAGSMLGGSVIKTAERVRAAGLSTSIISIDPFVGDVHMLNWEHGTFIAGEWRFIRNERGRPRIYDRFMANVKHAGADDLIVPAVTTASNGFKFVSRMLQQRRLCIPPQVIYLDSAHEQDETFIELLLAFQLLPPGGVLFGDDWNWEAVAHDVLRLAKLKRELLDVRSAAALCTRPSCTMHEGLIALWEMQWVIFKAA